MHLKRNSDDHSTDLEKLQLEKHHHSDVFTKPLTFVVIGFLMSIIVMLQNLSLISPNTSPQFTLQIMEGNNESIPILNNVKQSLLIITFLAEDFSLDNYTGMNGIDTFEPDTKFELYYNGYQKSSKGGNYFKADKGLDMFGCVVEDMATQLADISKSENPQKVIDSILVTYSFTIKNLEDMYLKFKKTGEVEGHFDESKLLVGHHAYSVESYGKTMTKFPVVSIFVSLFTCMNLLLLVNCMMFKGSVNHKFLIMIAMLQLPQCIVQFCSWTSQIRFQSKIGGPLESYNLGRLEAASGFHSLQWVTFMSLATQILLIYAYYILKKQ